MNHSSFGLVATVALVLGGVLGGVIAVGYGIALVLERIPGIEEGQAIALGLPLAALGGIGVAALASWIGRRLRGRRPPRVVLFRCTRCGTHWTTDRIGFGAGCDHCDGDAADRSLDREGRA